MIRRQLCATIKAGNTREAREWAKEMIEYLNQHYPEQHCDVLEILYGAARRLCFYSDADSLAVHEQIMAKQFENKTYQELSQKWLTLVENDWERIALQSF